MSKLIQAILVIVKLIAVACYAASEVTKLPQNVTYLNKKSLIGTWITLSPLPASTAPTSSTPVMCMTNVVAAVPCTCGTSVCATGTFCMMTPIQVTCTLAMSCQTGITTTPCICGTTPNTTCLVGQICTEATGMCSVPPQCSEGTVLEDMCACGAAPAQLCQIGNMCIRAATNRCLPPGPRCSTAWQNVICREGQTCMVNMVGVGPIDETYCKPVPCSTAMLALNQECLCGINTCNIPGDMCNQETGRCRV